MDEFLGPQISTHEYLRSASQYVLDQHDLDAPTPLASALQKVDQVKGWDIHGNREGNEAYYPDFDERFRAAFRETLIILTEGKDTANGHDIVRAYEQAATDTAHSKQMRSNMYHPISYGNMVDHFGIPVAPRIIGEMLLDQPLKARDYQIQAEKWRTGTTESIEQQ